MKAMMLPSRSLVRARAILDAKVAPRAATDIVFRFEPFYRVLLVYSGWPDVDDKDIGKKVKLSVPILSLGDSVSISRRARAEGRSIVVTVPEDEAGVFVKRLKDRGLLADVEEA